MSGKKIIVGDEAHCSGCGLFEELALENIEVPLRTDIAAVSRQPSSREEWRCCLEAVRECPSRGLSVQDAEDAPEGEFSPDRCARLIQNKP